MRTSPRFGLVAATALLSLAHVTGGCAASVGSRTADGATSSTDAGTTGSTDAVVVSRDSAPADTGGGSTGRVPRRHRAVAVACVRGNVGGGSDAGSPPRDCTTHAECAVLRNGRCVSGASSGGAQYCVSDACFEDTECSGGGVCECEHSTSSGWVLGGAHACLRQGNCRVDSDCGPGGYCSPSLSASCGSHSGVVGYFCHTREDRCVDDEDCTEMPAGYCAWQPTIGAWACAYTHCAG